MNLSYILVLLGTAICTYICYFIYQTQKLRALAHSHGCQPPRRYPHIDLLFGLDLFLRNGNLIASNKYLPDLQQRYRKLGRTYGQLSFGSGSIASVEPENIKTVWSTKFEDWGVQEFRLPGLMPWVGRGFVSVDGEEWEHAIALLKPSFRRANISNLEPFEDSFKEFLAQLPRDGSTVDLQVHFSNLYLDTATYFLFGESLGRLSGNIVPHAEGFLEAFQEGFRGSGMRIALGPFAFLLPKKRWLEACAKTHRFADHYVTKALEYRQDFLAGKIHEDDSKSGILLYNMAEQTGDPVYLRNQILQTLMAAQETTSNLLGNIFFLISRNETVFRKLRAEVLSVGGRLTAKELTAMKYVRNVINEALRLYPILPSLNRHALRDTMLPLGGGLGGCSPIFVPRGTKFDTSFYVLHHLPEIWGSDAEEFRPERWDTMKPGAWEYIPFAGGPRVCPGQQKALLESSYVIARMLQEFESIESRDERPWEGQVRLTAKNAHGCLVSLINHRSHERVA